MTNSPMVTALSREKPTNLTLRICHVCASSFTVKHMLAPLVEAAINRGWAVDLIFNKKSETEKFEYLKGRVIDVPVIRTVNPLKNIRFFFCLIKILLSQKYDIIHFHTPVAALWGRLAALFSGPSLVVYTAHGYYFHDRMSTLGYALHHAIEKILARLSDVIFCQSAEDYRTSLSSNFSPRRGVHYIGNGVSKLKFRLKSPQDTMASRRLFGLSSNDFVVGFAGRFTYEKGVLDLIRAFNVLSKKKLNAKLLMIGDSDLRERDAISQRDLIREIDGNPRIMLFGYSERVSDFLFAIDLFCLPSYREGVPRVIIEAMSCGVPVLGSEIRGIRELIKNKEFLFEPGDWKALADKLENLLSDEKALIDAGTENYRNSFEILDEAEIAEKQLNILAKYLRARG
jgi:glycosyltransferase involved in cell wall biosynthesis